MHICICIHSGLVHCCPIACWPVLTKGSYRPETGFGSYGLGPEANAVPKVISYRTEARFGPSGFGPEANSVPKVTFAAGMMSSANGKRKL